MKKLIIFFIVVVLIAAFSMTSKPKEIEGRELTEQEISEYRQSIIEGGKRFNKEYTEEEIETALNYYKTEAAKTKTSKGVSFAEALPKALIIAVIACAIVGMIFLIKGSYYNEALNSGFWVQGKKMSSEGRIEMDTMKAKRNFWGGWFR